VNEHEVPTRRIKACVEAWPDCETGLYDPRCCRFPKSCSCTIYDLEYVEDCDLEEDAPVVEHPEVERLLSSASRWSWRWLGWAAVTVAIGIGLVIAGRAGW
jgi:hypothetical protein